MPTYNGILLKEEFDEIVEDEDVLYLYDDVNDLIFDKRELCYEFEDYYEYETNNYKKITKIIELEVEEIEDKWNENDKTYHYNYYKVKDKDIYFRVFISHYQGTDPSLDQNWKGGQKNEKKIVANFKIEKSKWESFKQIAKINGSDATKELRKLVDKYIQENEDLLKLF